MYSRFHVIGTVGLGLILFSPALAAAGSPLRLTDPGLPLQELRPLDRHVWVLVLEGKWKEPPTPGISYHVNLLFPDGRSYSHRVLNDTLFAAGEVRCLIPEYQLVRHGLMRGGRFTVAVSARCTVTSASAPEVVSEGFAVRWPMNRPIVRWAPPTRSSPPPPIDAMPLPGQRLPAPPKGKVQPGEPPPVPD